MRTLGDGTTLLSAEGEIDLANRDALAAELAVPAADPAVRLLVCDLSATTFLACSGLSVLLDVKGRLAARDAVLRVVTADPTVLRMLDATGQRDRLDVRDNLDAALSGAAARATAPAPILLPSPAGHGLCSLTASLARAVEQTTQLAATWGRLAAQVAALDADQLVDGRGGHWRPRETLAEMAEDLRVLQNHLATGALLAAPTVEDLGHLRVAGGELADETAGR
jgi:anti-anti-sigma factor